MVTVSFQFTPDRSKVGTAFREALSYPPRAGAARGPHHLDLAHLDLLEQLPKGAQVLELGCGSGQMRQWTQDRGLRYLGTDLVANTRVHEFLKKHGGPDLLCDAHFLPFPNEQFDLVYSAAVTEHLACPFLVAQEVMRVLQPGGYYLGNVSFLEPWHDDSYFHMSPLGAFENLIQAGFEVLHIWPGQGYSGFRAIMNMGNKATKSLTWVGDAIDLLYRITNKFGHGSAIEQAARVAGATDWIARKPQ